METAARTDAHPTEEQGTWVPFSFVFFSSSSTDPLYESIHFNEYVVLCGENYIVLRRFVLKCYLQNSGNHSIPVGRLWRMLSIKSLLHATSGIYFCYSDSNYIAYCHYGYVYYWNTASLCYLFSNRDGEAAVRNWHCVVQRVDAWCILTNILVYLQIQPEWCLNTDLCLSRMENMNEWSLTFGLLFSTGISRDSLHKRRATGGKQNKWRKKRKYVIDCDLSWYGLCSRDVPPNLRESGSRVLSHICELCIFILII